MKKINKLKIKMAGYPNYDHLIVETGICQCGDIKDGVGLNFPGEGGWVLDWKDFEKAYHELRNIRSDGIERAINRLK